MKKFLISLGLLLVVVAVLAAWIAIPPLGALVLVVVLLAWLLLTRSGKRAAQILSMGLQSLPQRWGESLVIVIGIAGVVGVLVAMLSMGEGLKKTLTGSGDERTVILLRAGSQAETNSVITRDQVPRIGNLPGFAKGKDGRPLISAERSQVVNLQSRKDGTDTNVQFRGVGPAAFDVNPHVKLVDGRRFTPGLRELIAGRGASTQFRNLQVGKQLKLGNQIWTVVGIFASGDSHESELWTDADSLAAAYNRSDFQSVIGTLESDAAIKSLQTAIAADPTLKFDVATTKSYFAKQSEGLTKTLGFLGKIVAAIMAIGAIFGALNSMYAAVAGRAREIGTLRALGFNGAPVVAAIMLETMLLAVVGGALGAGLAWLLFSGSEVSTMGSNFSQVVFKFHVTPDLLWNGLKWALAIGFVGGFYPALRAARMRITDALRAL